MTTQIHPQDRGMIPRWLWRNKPSPLTKSNEKGYTGDDCGVQHPYQSNKDLSPLSGVKNTLEETTVGSVLSFPAENRNSPSRSRGVLDIFVVRHPSLYEVMMYDPYFRVREMSQWRLWWGHDHSPMNLGNYIGSLPPLGPRGESETTTPTLTPVSKKHTQL